jgi:hypothetical protein
MDHLRVTADMTSRAAFNIDDIRDVPTSVALDYLLAAVVSLANEVHEVRGIAAATGPTTAERKLARILQMANEWDAEWGDAGIRASIVAEAIRNTIEAP